MANLIGVTPFVIMLNDFDAMVDLALMLLGENEVNFVSGVPLGDSAAPLDDSGELALNLVSRRWPLGLASAAPYPILYEI